MRRRAYSVAAAVLAFLAAGRAALAGPLVPDDPKYSLEWYAQPGSPGTGLLGLPEAWGYSTGDPGVIVAILDTGVMTATPDLAGRLLPALSATGTPPFSDATLAAATILRHGTWVASVAAMGVNNGIGGAGVGNFSILPITIAGIDGHNTGAWVAEGIRMAADAGARVISCSHAVFPYKVVDDAAAYALTKGALVFMAGGNGNGWASRTGYDNLIFVSGTDQDDNRWDDGVAGGSTWGPFVDLAAPAEDVLAADPTLSTGYGLGDGTSFSAPLAAGAAALLWSINPSLTAAEVRGILYDTAVDLGDGGWDEVYGWGRLDIGAAAAAAHATVVPEPHTFGLMAAGAALALARRRRLRRERAVRRRSDRLALAADQP